MSAVKLPRINQPTNFGAQQLNLKLAMDFADGLKPGLFSCETIKIATILQ